MSICAVCGENRVPPNMRRCTGCGAWNQNETGIVGEVNEKSVISLSDVSAAKISRIITTGPWDEVWGGGFVPGSCTLLGGSAGMGKTSIMLMLMSIFCKLTGKLGYYIGAEQAASELRLTADRFQIDNLDRIKVLREFGSGADIDRELMKKHPPCCVVVDSVSAMCGKDKDAALAVAKKHKRLAVEFNCLSFLICHMNKEGDFAGLYALQHEVDTIITIFGPMDHEREVAKLAREGHSDDTLDGLRVLMPWKNRYGPTGKEVFLTMGPHGLLALPPLEKKGKRGKESKDAFLLHPEAPPTPETGAPAAPSAAIVAQAQRKPPETILQDGQKLVRRVKGARSSGKPEKAVEGEALKKRRAPMARTAKKATKSAKPTKVAKKAVQRQEPKKRASKKGSARTKGART